MDPYDECNNGGSRPGGGNVTGPAGPVVGLSATNPQPTVSTDQIDACINGYFSATQSYPANTLRFTMYSPEPLLADLGSATKANDGTTTDPSGWTLVNKTATEDFGADNLSDSHQWKWFTFAQFTNNTGKTQYVKLNVHSVKNGDGS